MTTSSTSSTIQTTTTTNAAETARSATTTTATETTSTATTTTATEATSVSIDDIPNGGIYKQTNDGAIGTQSAQTMLQD